MEAITVVQYGDEQSVLAAIHSLVSRVRPSEIVFCFAYATTSGFAEFERTFGKTFWEETRTRWLVSIDWGRTQPSALELLRNRRNTAVRVFDGDQVVDRKNFVPATPYHPKACFLLNRRRVPVAAFAGSGNFSRGGLVANVECGIALDARDNHRFVGRAWSSASAIWETSTPVEELLDTYKRRWKPNSVVILEEQEPDAVETLNFDHDHFWIEAGYVTPNRGRSKPGNQIDMPRGVHRFFGLTMRRNQRRNTVIGPIRFLFDGLHIDRNLRYGNNQMEKITLPIPEQYGYGSYDGKILEFHREERGFRLEVHEPEEFRYLRAGAGKIMQMDSGRHLGVW